MPKKKEHRGQLAFELRITDSQVTAASFASMSEGGVAGLFSCSVGALADDDVAALERAAYEHTPVRLLFSESPVLLDLVTLERREPHAVRIIGHVVRLTNETA